MANRFDYIEYDKSAQLDQIAAKNWCKQMECFIDTTIKSPRAKALAFTKLEECYMWIGKGIRDDQIERHGTQQPLQEQRSNS